MKHIVSANANRYTSPGDRAFGHLFERTPHDADEPIVAVALAAIVLSESITPFQALGGILILVAVVILARNEMRRSKQTSTP
jgi:hypothetical protein